MAHNRTHMQSDVNQADPAPMGTNRLLKSCVHKFTAHVHVYFHTVSTQRSLTRVSEGIESNGASWCECSANLARACHKYDPHRFALKRAILLYLRHNNYSSLLYTFYHTFQYLLYCTIIFVQYLLYRLCLPYLAHARGQISRQLHPNFHLHAPLSTPRPSNTTKHPKKEI